MERRFAPSPDAPALVVVALDAHPGLGGRGAFECGFCTPGFVLTTKQLLDENPEPSEDEIKHYLSGNLCRCGAYP